jgi:hypothetical protein
MIIDERDHGFTCGRAPPGQNTLTPCEESRSPGEVRSSRAPRPSASRPYRSEPPPACRCRPPSSGGSLMDQARRSPPTGRRCVKRLGYFQRSCHPANRSSGPLGGSFSNLTAVRQLTYPQGVRHVTQLPFPSHIEHPGQWRSLWRSLGATITLRTG